MPLIPKKITSWDAPVVSETRKLVIGLEGGGTKTTLILTDTIGHKILTINGPASNPISGSISNTCDVIDELINKISNELEKLEIYHSFHNGIVDWRGKCVAVGIALSGGSSEKVKSEILNYFKNDTSLNQSLADKIVVLTDPQAAIASCCLKSGMTMIAGTGSICYLFSNIDKFFFDKSVSSRVGGWGYMFSDEGSAFDITKICLKTVFDFYDSFGIGNINKGERFLKEKGVQELRDALFAHFCCSSLTQLCAKGSEKCTKNMVRIKHFNLIGNRLLDNKTLIHLHFSLSQTTLKHVQVSLFICDNYLSR